MKLNDTQKKILILAAFILVGLCLFVPWISYDERSRREEARGYSWIMDPPYLGRIDVVRMLVPMVLVVGVAGVAVMATGEKRPD